MSVKPILFSGPMVRAILEGRKTQTRRVLRPQPDPFDALFSDDGRWWTGDDETGEVQQVLRVPYAPGDLLWVREAFRGDKGYDSSPPREWSHWPVHYEAEGAPDPDDEIGMNGRLRPGMFMPRWASRLTLRVTDVRVQRLQELSDADAIAEGVPQSGGRYEDEHSGRWHSCTVAEFRSLWDGLNAKRGYGWQTNPWVAAYTFEVIRQNVDEVAA
ncbi:MAG: hypothetical protein HWE30_18835 [Methylocystaceae bacterium]|nr:hypothetical protein [Methylocystaceae bacterium]